ncbi:MAG: caspase domain-containing protein [Paracoccaceae bacterium]
MRILIWTSLLCSLWGGVAAAETRIALVIGNSAYGRVAALDNPANDARLIAEKLTQVGFDVTTLTDATLIEMKRAIAQFGRALRQSDTETVGLVYYAGHGVQSFGSNYLLPVDVDLSDSADLDLMAVDARSVLHQMATAKNHTNILILDACRNNPFEDLPDLDDPGLAEMKAPSGSFLAYATAPGGVALDGDSGNSPFSQSLATHLTRPGASIEDVFKHVRVDVRAASDGQQTPWDTSSLTEHFVFVPDIVPTETLSEPEAWAHANRVQDALSLLQFLRTYPESDNQDVARTLFQNAVAEEFGLIHPRTTTDNQVERDMYDLARMLDTREGYDIYLRRFPNGAGAKDAKDRKFALAQEVEAATRHSEQEPVTLRSTLTVGNAAVRGYTLEALLSGTALYPPDEAGLEETWQEQTCSECHTWSLDELCELAGSYLKRPPSGNLAQQHPFGGGLKLNMRRWAKHGCQP